MPISVWKLPLSAIPAANRRFNEVTARGSLGFDYLPQLYGAAESAPEIVAKTLLQWVPV